MNWKNKLNADPIPYLLQSNPWTKYRTLIDLLEVPKDAEKVKKTYEELTQNQQIQTLITEINEWFPQSITRHNVPYLSHYKFLMLAEFGLEKTEGEIPEIIKTVTSHVDKNSFSIRQTLPQKGEGFSKPDPQADEWHAMPCDSPLITYSLLLLGHKDEQVQKSIESLNKFWETKQGWFCHFFFVDGQFKKHKIGCPMAGLMALQVFSQVPELKESVYAKNAYEPIKFHRAFGKSIYFFGRSKKFWTFKYPFVWYNALYLADVLTRFDFLKDEELVKELVKWIETAQDENGRFKPTSIFMPYKSWDFGNKKEPSPWITFLCCRILKRWYG
jgi:hypothetical protein